MTSSSLTIVRAFYDRIWNAGDLDAAGELLPEDFVFRGSLGAGMRGRAGFVGYVQMVRAALAGYRCDILECVTEGNRAFAKMRFSGTHVGRLRGYKPTGKAIEWLGAALFRMDGPMIAELWVLGDLISLERDLRKNAEAVSS